MIPLDKQSKKARREFFASRRGDWNGICPATRVEPSKKTYSRRKSRQMTLRMIDAE